MIDTLLKDGDRLYYFGTNFLDRQIIGNQRKLEKLSLSIFPPLPKIFGNDIPSHEATFFNIGGVWDVYESVGAGFKPDPFFTTYKTTDPYVILRSKDGYTPDQVNNALRCAQSLVKVSELYGYTSLLYWEMFTYSKGKINLFHIAGQKLEYCYESTYLIRQSTDYDNFHALKPVPWWASIRDDDKIIYDNRK